MPKVLGVDAPALPILRRMVALALAGHLSAAAACGDLTSVFEEPFEADASGWIDRDAAEMEIGWDGFGRPHGSLRGRFSSQIIPIPEADAFRAAAASSSGLLTGDYGARFPDAAGWQFDFYAADFLPSALSLRFESSGSSYFTSLTDQVDRVGVWHRVVAILSEAEAWNGGSATEAELDAALASVGTLDVQVLRNGTAEQVYYLDNFQVLQSSIPEPSPLGYLAAAILLLLWRLRSGRPVYGLEWSLARWLDQRS
jgi:hypothetical protein